MNLPAFARLAIPRFSDTVKLVPAQFRRNYVEAVQVVIVIPPV